jgi:DNA-binding NarL/FixJ family response regulator
MKFNILLYDKFPIIRSALFSILKKKFVDSDVILSNSLEELIFLSNKIKFDLILLDIDLSDKKNVDIFNRFWFFNNNVKVIFFTETSLLNRYNQNQLKKMKFLFLLDKNSSQDKIIQYVKLSILGDVYYSNIILLGFKEDENLNNKIYNKRHSLSKREFECAVLLLKGFNVKSISEILSVGITTISTYKMRIFKKTNTKNLIELNDHFKNVI